jgi:hypothetical protein
MLTAPGPIEVVAGHEAPPKARLGEGDRRMRHRLLVVGAIGRQFVAHLVERLADAGDVAVAEDRPHAAEDRHHLAVDHGHLPCEVARQRLRHGQADGLGHRLLLPLQRRILRCRPRPHACLFMPPDDARGKPCLGQLLETLPPCRRSPPRRRCGRPSSLFRRVGEDACGRRRTP